MRTGPCQVAYSGERGGMGCFLFFENVVAQLEDGQSRSFLLVKCLNVAVRGGTEGENDYMGDSSRKNHPAIEISSILRGSGTILTHSSRKILRAGGGDGN